MLKITTLVVAGLLSFAANHELPSSDIRVGVVSSFNAEVVSISNCTISFVTCDDQSLEYPFRIDIGTGLPSTSNGHTITVGDEGYWEVSSGANHCNFGSRPWVSYFVAQDCN